MRLALPWLDVIVADATADLDAELTRATVKFSTGTTEHREQVSLFAECRASVDLGAVRQLEQKANIRFQFVWGRVGTACSSFGTADGSLAVVDHMKERIDLALSPDVFTAPYSTWNDLVAAPLAEHWRARECYPLHAGAVAFGTDRILVCGASGSGKTTTTLAFVTAGATWRADDKVLVRVVDGRLEAVSLYRNTNLAPATVAHYPSLGFTLDRAPIDETNDKRPCDLAELGLIVDLAPFAPTSILFPRRSGRAVSTLRRLRDDEALVRLSAQSPTSACHARLRGQHEILVALARRVPAWEVEAGRDVLGAPAEFTARVLEVVGQRPVEQGR